MVHRPGLAPSWAVLWFAWKSWVRSDRGLMTIYTTTWRRWQHLKRIFKLVKKRAIDPANHVVFPIENSQNKRASIEGKWCSWVIFRMMLIGLEKRDVFFNFRDLLNQFLSRFSIITANNTINAGSIHFIASINIFWLNRGIRSWFLRVWDSRRIRIC